MLATKKLGGAGRAFALLTATVFCLTGCTPAGPRALLEGERLVKEQRYGDAIEQLRKATSLLPNNAQAWNHLGLASHLAGLPDASEAYKRALAINPNLGAARFNLGCFWLENGQPKEAALHLASYVLLEPKDTDARILLGSAQLLARQTDDAEKTYKDLLAAQGGLPTALNGQAITQVQRKRARDAAATLLTALQIQQDYAPALLNLAIVNHAYLGNKPQALHYYRAYLTLNPRPLYYDHASLAVRQLEAELTTLPPAPVITNLPLPPATNGPTLTNRIAAPPTRTNPPMATTATNKPATVAATNKPVIARIPPATNTAPPAPAPQTNLVVAKAEPPPPALNDAPRYKYLRPTPPAAGDRAKAMPLYAAGQKAQEDKRQADALLNYEAATKVDPAFFEAYARWARTALDAGDTAKALPAFEHALALNPDSGATRFNFALALHQAGYWADAAAELEKFFEQTPQEANGRLFLANLYLQNFKAPARARPHYLKFVELEPQNPQAPAIREWLLKNP